MQLLLVLQYGHWCTIQVQVQYWTPMTVLIPNKSNVDLKEKFTFLAAGQVKQCIKIAIKPVVRNFPHQRPQSQLYDCVIKPNRWEIHWFSRRPLKWSPVSRGLPLLSYTPSWDCRGTLGWWFVPPKACWDLFKFATVRVSIKVTMAELQL